LEEEREHRQLAEERTAEHHHGDGWLVAELAYPSGCEWP
jgi:hypothetical protein